VGAGQVSSWRALLYCTIRTLPPQRQCLGTRGFHVFTNKDPSALLELQTYSIILLSSECLAAEHTNDQSSSTMKGILFSGWGRSSTPVSFSYATYRLGSSRHSFSNLYVTVSEVGQAVLEVSGIVSCVQLLYLRHRAGFEHVVIELSYQIRLCLICTLFMHNPDYSTSIEALLARFCLPNLLHVCTNF
jgi:hypothetical protein